MKTPVVVFESPDSIGEHLAARLLERFSEARDAGLRFLLGCPTGRTPRPVYDSIARRLSETGQDMSHVVLVMMDEYLQRSGATFEYASADAPWSCHNFVRREIVNRWNQDLPTERRVREDSVWFPNPADPAAYDKRITDAGGIDFFLLASGASDGHVAFNPPGSPRESRTRIIELPESTRRDNLQTFPAFETLDAVPTHGISVGIATIAAAKEAVMLLWGRSKAESLRRIEATDRYDSNWPATVIYACARGEILADRDAAEAIEKR
ncbi:MAG TPA: 6-phosphogluconolactonase [Gemmatimonadaceae bacterium]